MPSKDKQILETVMTPDWLTRVIDILIRVIPARYTFAVLSMIEPIVCLLYKFNLAKVKPTKYLALDELT